MLGAQTWFVAFAVPTVAVGAFVATRKRLGFQWREELMDADDSVYPTVTDADMQLFRQVSPAEQVRAFGNLKERPIPLGEPLNAKDNKGWFVSYYNAFEKLYAEICLSEIRELATHFGISIDPRKLTALAALVKYEEEKGTINKQLFDLEHYTGNKIISDHPEDTQLMKAPWGCGDALKVEKLPLVLRFLSNQVQKVYPNIGRLRHVYVEYSPSGKFFRDPKSPKAFDGHDYVVIPLRMDARDTVITFVPSLRSKYTSLSEIINFSWTNRDIDARIPNGAMLRVYGSARYDWGWGMRPGNPWWGSRFMSALDRSSGNSEDRSQVKLKQYITKCLFFRWGHKNSNDTQHGTDAALVVLHYEGPRSKGKARSLLLHPESLIFGYPPKVENFEVWEEDKPTPEDIQKIGILKYVASNYITMLQVS